jgi:hypothetical protein
MWYSPSLQQLLFLETVLEEGNIVRAADRLHMIPRCEVFRIRINSEDRSPLAKEKATTSKGRKRRRLHPTNRNPILSSCESRDSVRGRVRRRDALRSDRDIVLLQVYYVVA